jgi:hypothetical protein
MVDIRRTEWTEFRVERDPACPVCSASRKADPKKRAG